MLESRFPSIMNGMINRGMSGLSMCPNRSKRPNCLLVSSVSTGVYSSLVFHCADDGSHTSAVYESRVSRWLQMSSLELRLETLKCSSMSIDMINGHSQSCLDKYKYAPRDSTPSEKNALGIPGILVVFGPCLYLMQLAPLGGRLF